MADPDSVAHNAPEENGASGLAARRSQIDFKDLWGVVARHRRAYLGIWAACLLLSLLYWILASNQFESSAKILVLSAPAQPPTLDGPTTTPVLSALTATLRQETVASMLRGEGLAWKVILAQRLYEKPAFAGRFATRFPDFKADAPSREARAWLLQRFERRLNVQSQPHTLLIEVGFRSQEAGLSAQVIGSLLQAYAEQAAASRLESYSNPASWLERQLHLLKEHLEQEQQRLSEFQRLHGLLLTPESTSERQSVETQHAPQILEVDELGRQLATAVNDRIVREAQYQAALSGDPEAVSLSLTQSQGEAADVSTSMLHKIRSTRGELELEAAQLRTERGPNYPRLQEIENQIQDLDRQKRNEDKKLVEHFRTAWQTALEREKSVRTALDERMAPAMKVNRDAAEYTAMRQEVEASRAIYLRMRSRSEEAAVAAGLSLPDFTVADPPTLPIKPVTPNLLVSVSLGLLTGFWLALGGVFLLESIRVRVSHAVVFLLVLLPAHRIWAQAPTPSTSGLPTGVARIPLSQQSHSLPNPMESPAVWTGQSSGPGAVPAAGVATEAVLQGPISAGDFLEIGEFRTPEFRTRTHVSATGSVTLPLIGEVSLAGLEEDAAARAIESALARQGILLHPNVSVLVLTYASQNVSVLGEVTHPGVYPYTAHHRLLDLISAASGLTPNAGSLVNILPRGNSSAVRTVVLDPSAKEAGDEHNPELRAGDTVQVSRAGLVYVVGDVIRPGGFTVDPKLSLTVAQAVSLAWGPSQNANTRKAVLIREQAGNRAIIKLDLKRILRGLDPDQPVYDRDILFVPDSTAKNLWNRTIESAIQSLVGVSIYSGLVYSQRY